MDKKIVKLMKEGFSFRTLNNMSQRNLNLLYEKMTKEENKEAVTMVKGNNKTEIDNLKRQGVTFQVYEADEEDSMDFEKGERTQDPKQVGPASDDGFDSYGDGMPTENEMKEGDKKGKKRGLNPYAICTKTFGDIFGTPERSKWSDSQMKTYEKCVVALKSGPKKGKNIKESLVESLIFALVEKHIEPSMTKKDFMTYILEQNPGTKEKEREKTKTPGKPKDDPKDPFSPKPGVKPRPKASEPGTKEREKTKTPVKPKDNPNDPFSPKPGIKPRPKAKGENSELPDFLSYENIFKHRK
jgi:hypothetical protein